MKATDVGPAGESAGRSRAETGRCDHIGKCSRYTGEVGIGVAGLEVANCVLTDISNFDHGSATDLILHTERIGLRIGLAKVAGNQRLVE